MAKAPSTSTRKSTTTRAKSTTSTRKTTTSRSTTKAPVTGQTASASKAPAPLPKTTPRTVSKDIDAAKIGAPEATGLPEMRKRELVDAVVDRSGIKKRYAKPAIEAALAILGEALEEGRSLQMPPLGRVKVQRAKELEDGQVIVAKVRRKTQVDDEEGAKSDEEPLAKAAE